MVAILFLLWIILNGKITLEICLFGVGITALIYTFAHFAFGLGLKDEMRFWKKAGLLFCYIIVLIVEVLKANFSVMGIILRRKAEYHPAIVKIKVPLKRNFTRVLLANSITLTPGTITVDLTEDEYTIQCLDRAAAEGLEDGIFVRMLKKID